MDFKATLEKALEDAPAAFAVVQTASGEFVAVANAGTEREVLRTLGGTTVWFR